MADRNGTEEKKLDSPDREKIEGRVIDYLRYLNGEGLLPEESKVFRVKHYNNPYELGREITKALIEPLIEEAKTQEKERIATHLDKLCKYNPIKTGALRQELGKYIQILKEAKQ